MANQRHLQLVSTSAGSRRHRTLKQLRAQPYVGFTYYLGGTMSVLRKIEAKFPDVDTTRVELAILKLRRELKAAWRGR
jgi:hypothetical protein